MALATSAVMAQSSSFGPLTVPGTAVIFDPDNVLSADQLAMLSGGGAFHPTPAVKALTFTAAPGQTMTFSASGQVGCCGVAQIGPDGYPGDRANITSLGSISGFVSPNGLPLVGVFTNGSPSGAAPAAYDYSAGLGQATFSPLLNQVFIIGDGLTGTGAGQQQTFNIPAQATELWLGFVDGGNFAGPPGNYADNAGSEEVYGVLNGPCPLNPTSNPISSETLAHVPGIGDARTCIGINESVRLTTGPAGQAATWTITSNVDGVGLSQSLQAAQIPFKLMTNAGFPTQQCAAPTASGPIYGNQVCFTAPMTTATIVVTAKFDNNQTASETFTVLQPSGLIFQRLQSPPKSPDYSFSNDFRGPFWFSIEMESVIFLTPGNVSFASVGFSELDRPDSFFGVKLNALFDLGGTHAWLLSCDYDHQPEVGTLAPESTQSNWVFAATQTSKPTPFAVETTNAWFNFLEDLPYGAATFSKGQIKALAPNGNLMPTPGAPFAVLKVPGVNHNDFQPVPDSTTCLKMVKEQFTMIP